MNLILFSVCVTIFCGMVPLVASAPPNGTPAAVIVKPENITGTLTIVDPDQRVIYVKSADGIVYDFRIVESTKIAADGAKISFEDLSAQIGKSIEVVFRPLKIGNVAQSVDLK